MSYIFKEKIKNGSVIPLKEALSTDGLVDEEGGDPVIFDSTDFPFTFYVEANGKAYTFNLNDVQVKLRIEPV